MQLHQGPWIRVRIRLLLLPFVLRSPRLTLEPAFFYPQESPEAVAFHKSNAIGNRLTDVKDIAPLIRFLVTEGGWITGQTIFANGGYTSR